MTTNENKRLAALKSLIGMGKSQGYLVRAEAATMLPAELLDDEQLTDVLAMIGDMGIFVVDKPPTATELAAMKGPPVSTAPTPAIALPPVGPPIGPPIVALKVGAEGGEIRLIAQELAIGWRYRYSMLDQTYLWLDEGGGEIRRQSEWVYEWRDALVSLDKYPWAALHPMEVHPQFAARVLEAARERLTRDESSSRARGRLIDWSALCRGHAG